MENPQNVDPDGLNPPQFDSLAKISERILATAPKVAAVLQGIHTRSPKARVLVVNYAAILPDEGPGCWPQMPITDGDVPYVRAKQKELNAMLAAQAAANAAELVDWYTASIRARRVQAARHPLGRTGCAGERCGPAPSESWRDDRSVGAADRCAPIGLEQRTW